MGRFTLLTAVVGSIALTACGDTAAEPDAATDASQMDAPSSDATAMDAPPGDAPAVDAPAVDAPSCGDACGALDAGVDSSIDAGTTATVYVKASNTDATDALGIAVALSADGSTLAVGASGEASNATGVGGDQANDAAPGAGAVYVYTRSATGWSQEAYLKASNTDSFDAFGSDVALSADGSTLAVGAYHEASSATGIGGDQTSNAAMRAGAVYVFTRTGTTWSQQGYLKASNTDAGDEFGGAIALSDDGSTLAVGANQEASAAVGIGGDQTSNVASQAGAVYLFARSGTTWSQQAYVKASNSDAGDYFGYAVALSSSGSTLAVGALDERSNATGVGGNQANDAAAGAGAVYVFTRAGTAWSQQAYVKASNTGSDDEFGFTVALSSDGATLAVGAWAESSNATGVGGDQTNDAASRAGAVYVFTVTGTTWAQQAYIKASNTDAGDTFGNVALSGDGATLVVGAENESSSATGIDGDQTSNAAAGAGAIYVFDRAGATWSQQHYLKASNTDPGDEFSWSLALSADRSTLAVGAPYESSNATGVGGDQTDDGASGAGAVYVLSPSP